MNETDKILEEEIRNVVPDEWVGLASSWASRFLPNNAFEASVELDMSTEGALAELEYAAGHLGQVIGRKASAGGTRLTVVIRAGFLNMMPAVVDIYITPLGDERCRVRIAGTAKESLIRQRAGEGAVRRLLADEELRDGLRKNAEDVVFAYKDMHGGIDRRSHRRMTFVLAAAAIVFSVLTAILVVFVITRPA